MSGHDDAEDRLAPPPHDGQPKVLFVDHQGVLYLRRHPWPGRLDDFEPAQVSALNCLCELEPDLQLVVSSDWRCWCSIEDMRSFYRRQGIRAPVVDYTPVLARRPGQPAGELRAREISGWLRLQPRVRQWAAVDDLDLSELGRRAVRVSGGLSEGADRIIQALQGTSDRD